MKFLEECNKTYLSHATKIFINGNWLGVSNNPKEMIATLLQEKRQGKINPYNSISWNISVLRVFDDQ